MAACADKAYTSPTVLWSIQRVQALFMDGTVKCVQRWLMSSELQQSR